MKKPVLAVLAMLIALPLCCQGAKPVKFAPVFTDNLVIPREVPVPVWGRGEPGRTVELSFRGQRKSGKVDASGAWRVTLDPEPANADDENELVAGYGPDDPDSVACVGVLIGDVWIAAGQSNMEFGISAVADRAEQLKDAKYPAVRLFLVPKTQSPYPTEALPGFWLPCERANLTTGGWNGFSAIGFMFARRLYKETGIPQGIIETAFGGSAIEPWIAPEELASFPALKKWNDFLNDAEAAYRAAFAKDPSARHPWESLNDYDKLKPATLYRSMVKPIAPFPVKGVIWYQGESNVGDGAAYTEKMEALVASYRRTFADPSLPFYYVQLAPWGGYGGALTSMWAAQEAALRIKGSGMVATIDVGDAGDIHPRDKAPVADRLAFLALKYAYGKKAPESPYVKSIEAEGKTLVLALAETDGGLKARDGSPLRGFRLSADGSAFYPAQAVIDGDRIILSCAQVDKPKAADYAWQDLPDANLVGASGLPARPWKGGMQ